ncbi:ribosome maturation protein [Pseudoneurospora amorphoporcata]|uniref:Ribosome maturation protein n=1 Tax=Pseudoneurospora amorphoporcata TaxID=241081 RepID=A0AAN6SKM6_9PEZI|nr:ribosome maturation protein [Pseudoneurospora amorphoporcata]
MRGGATETKVHFKGNGEDFLVFVDSKEDYNKWVSDKSTPLAQVVSGFEVFTTHNHGTQGRYETASKSTLENEFGSTNPEDAIKQILEKGTLQESAMAERQGRRNDSNGEFLGR